MFLELFRGKTIKALPEGALNIWKQWYTTIIKRQGTEEIIHSLTTLMMEEESSIVYLDTLYDHPVLSTYVRDIQINNPFQQLIEKGVLSQYFLDNEIVISFTMDALLHYCLSISIENNKKYAAIEDLYDLSATNKLPGIHEAIKYLLWEDIKNKDYSRLNYFINKGGYMEIAAFPLAQAFILFDVDEVLKKIFLESSENEWRIINKAIYELDDAQEQLVKKDLLLKILAFSKIQSIIECYVLLDAIEFVNKEGQIKLLESIINAISNFKDFPENDKRAIYNNIGTVFSDQGDYDKAIEYYLKSLDILEKVFGKKHPETAISYYNIGNMYSSKGDYDKAIEYHLKSLGIREKVLGKEHPDTASSYNNLGSVYSDKQDYDKALEYMLLSLEIRERVLGKEHPDTANSYNNLGLSYYDQDDYDKAIEYLPKSLEIKEKISGKDSSNGGQVMKNIAIENYVLGKAYFKNDLFEKAKEAHTKALELRIKLFGEDSSEVKQVKEYLEGNIEYMLNFEMGLDDEYVDEFEGDFSDFSKEDLIQLLGESEGIEFYEILNSDDEDSDDEELDNEELDNEELDNEELDNEESDNEESDNNELDSSTEVTDEESIRNKVETYLANGKQNFKDSNYAEALNQYQQALKSSELLPENDKTNKSIADIYYGMGEVNKTLEDYDTAIDNYIDAYNHYIKVSDRNYGDTASVCSFLGDVYYYKENYKEAIENHEEAADHYIKAYGANSTMVAWAYYDLGRDNYRSGNYYESVNQFKKALELRIRKYGEKHEDVAVCYMQIADSYFQTDEEGKAVQNYRNAYLIRKNLTGLEKEADDSLFQLGMAYDIVGDNIKAKECVYSSLKFRKGFFGKNSDEYNEVKKWIEENL